MIKKYKWLILFIAIIIALIVVCFVFSEDEDKYIHDIGLSDVIDKMDNKDSFILYIKQTDCEHCKAFTPNFISVLSQNNIEAYSLNLSNLSEEENTTYSELFDVEGTPTVLFFEDGNESLIRIQGEQTKAKIKSKIKSAGFIK
ncbi:MAG: thioredoxin family protein [Bacilli bacterium]